MLADFSIPMLSNDTMIAVQKHHLGGQILYRSPGRVKKTASLPRGLRRRGIPLRRGWCPFVYWWHWRRRNSIFPVSLFLVSIPPRFTRRFISWCWCGRRCCCNCAKFKIIFLGENCEFFLITGGVYKDVPEI